MSSAHRAFRGRRFTLAIAAAAFTAFAGPVLADCYDVLGCTNQVEFSAHYAYLASPDGPTCDFLYQMRNRIYAEHGYCFKTARGIAEIGNAGCHISDINQVALSQIERDNAATILKAENARHCSV
jgi:hypothetical protein